MPDECRSASLTLEGRFRAMFEHSPLAVQIFSADGRSVHVNPAWVQLWGISARDAAGINIHQAAWVREHDLGAYVRRAFEGQVVELPTVRIECISVSGGGSPADSARWVRPRMYPVSGREEEVLEVILQLEDVTEQKDAREAIRVIEERYRIVEQATNDAIWDYDFTAGIIHWSPNVQRVFGYSPEEIEPGVDWWEDRIHPEDAARTIASLEAAVSDSDRRWQCEYRFRRADGTYAHVIDRGSTLTDDAGRPIRLLGSMIDISSRVQAEQALRDTEERSRTLIASLPHRVFFKDTDGTYVTVNQRFADDFGCSPSELIGKTDLDLYQPEEARRFRDQDQEVMSSRASLSSVETMSSPNGVRHIGIVNAPVIDDLGKVIGVLGLFTDVTDRIEAQMALRDSEARLRMALQAARMRTWDYDILNDRIIWTGLLDPLFGEGPDTVRGRFSDFIERIHPLDRDRVTSSLQRATAESAPYSVEFRSLRKDGAVSWNSTRGTVIPDDTGAPARIVGVSIDITEMKAAEDQIKRRSAELELLYEAGRALGQSLEPSAVFDTMRDLVAQSMDCDALIVSEFDHAREEIRCLYAWVDGERVKHDQFPPLPLAAEGRGVQSTVIRTGESLLIQDVAVAHEQCTSQFFVTREGAVKESPEETSPTIRSVIYVPIKWDGKVLGVVQASSYQPAAYSQNQLRVFEALTQQMGAAIRNAHLYERARLELAERRKAEEAVREKHKLLSSVIEGITDAIFVKDLEGRYILINSAGASALGESPENVIGKDDSCFMAGAELTETRENDCLAFHSKTPITYESCGMKDGKTLFLLSTKAPYYDHNGRLVGIVGISRDITSLKRVEEEVKQRSHQLETLSRRVVEVQEQERNQIARELHDEIGQLLTGLRLVIAINKRIPEKAAEAMDRADSLVQELMERVSEMSLDLRPTMLDDLGLIPALTWHFRRFTEQTTVQVHFTEKGGGRRYPKEVETAAYRIVQEALTNVARYAGVNEARVELTARKGILRLKITDSGRGFDSARALSARDSAGLAGMRERAVLLGGTWKIRSSPQHGTSVVAELPALPVNSPTSD